LITHEHFHGHFHLLHLQYNCTSYCHYCWFNWCFCYVLLSNQKDKLINIANSFCNDTIQLLNGGRYIGEATESIKKIIDRLTYLITQKEYSKLPDGFKDTIKVIEEEGFQDKVMIYRRYLGSYLRIYEIYSKQIDKLKYILWIGFIVIALCIMTLASVSINSTFRNVTSMLTIVLTAICLIMISKFIQSIVQN